MCLLLHGRTPGSAGWPSAARSGTAQPSPAGPAPWLFSPSAHQPLGPPSPRPTIPSAHHPLGPSSPRLIIPSAHCPLGSLPPQLIGPSAHCPLVPSAAELSQTDMLHPATAAEGISLSFQAQRGQPGPTAAVLTVCPSRTPRALLLWKSPA